MSSDGEWGIDTNVTRERHTSTHSRVQYQVQYITVSLMGSVLQHKQNEDAHQHGSDTTTRMHLPNSLNLVAATAEFWKESTVERRGVKTTASQHSSILFPFPNLIVIDNESDPGTRNPVGMVVKVTDCAW